MRLLGLHGGVTQLQNEASATLLVDGNVIAACEEERFMRQKGGFGLLPIMSIQACLETANLNITDIDMIAHSGSQHQDLRGRISRYLIHHFGYAPQIDMIDHQMAHLSSAYFQSGLDQATCISYDGYGDNSSMAIASAHGNNIKILSREGINNSLGRFYSAITSFLGFTPQDSEYKVMGLAPYGRKTLSLDDIISISDETFAVDSDFFVGYGKSAQSSKRSEAITSRFEPWYSKKMVSLLGEPRRKADEVGQFHMDVAHVAQKAFENAIITTIRQAVAKTGISDVVLAGGCALNCKANGLIASMNEVSSLFVQPAASDRGLSLGSALACFHSRTSTSNYIPKKLEHVFWGPIYAEEYILDVLKSTCQPFSLCADPSLSAARDLADGLIVGWFQGRSEFGPRALGHRSILANPVNPEAKKTLNAKVKYREEFRPFAPAVTSEKSSVYFESEHATSFMTTAVKVKPDYINILPSTTHVDKTARVQVVKHSIDPLFYDLIKNLGELTGYEVVLNTSFNVMGEPIVESPRDALRTFWASGIDVLYIQSYIIRKNTL
jgi:carbamoyltransferase